MPPLTCHELDSLDALYAKATKGEWASTWETPDPEPATELGESDQIIATSNGEMVVGTMYYDGLWAGCNRENAAYIAALHNAFPRLAAAARRAEWLELCWLAVLKDPFTIYGMTSENKIPLDTPENRAAIEAALEDRA